MVRASCAFEMPDGLRCRAPALRGKALCYWHDPDKAEEAAESRRIGGLHRRKAKSVATIYDFSGLRTIEGAQRLLETAAIETLALENSISRNRTLISAAAGAGKLIDVGDHEERIRSLEAIADAHRGADEGSGVFPDSAQ